MQLADERRYQAEGDVEATMNSTWFRSSWFGSQLDRFGKDSKEDKFYNQDVSDEI